MVPRFCAPAVPRQGHLAHYRRAFYLMRGRGADETDLHPPCVELFRHVARPSGSGPAANRTVVMYHSPVSGRMTTIILPWCSGRQAIASTVRMAASDGESWMMRSVRARSGAVA